MEEQIGPKAGTRQLFRLAIAILRLPPSSSLDQRSQAASIPPPAGCQAHRGTEDPLRIHTRTAGLALLAAHAVVTLSTPSLAKEREARAVLSGPHASLFAGTPKALRREALALRGEAKARAVVSALAPDASRASLELHRISHDRFGDGDEIVSFGQIYRGLPVVGFGAAVRMDKDGDVVFSSVDLATRDLPASTKPTVTKAEAVARVSTSYGLSLPPSDAYLVITQTFEGPKLAYVVLPSLPLASGAMPRFVVDANDGVILEARDMRVFGSAQVYPSNPEKSKDVKLLPFAMEPVDGKLENPFVRTLNCIDRKQAKDVSFSGFKIKVHTCDLEQLARPNAESNFVYESKDVPDPAAAEDVYSEVSMYYHATRGYAYFRKLQGSDDAQVVADKPLRTIANLRVDGAVTSGNIAAAGDVNVPLAPFQNAFFSPKGGGLGEIFAQIYGFNDGSMWFGQGPRRDYSYDGDVVIHELGHAVVDHSIKLESWTIDSGGASAAPGSMNEGLADYFAAAVTGDPDVGEYASKDFSETAKVIRTLTNTDTCENAIVGEVHFDSTLFSGALWESRTKLPEADREKLDAAVYKTMRTNPSKGRVSYTELAQLILATVGTDLPSAKAIVTAAFTERKVLPGCVRIRSFEGKPLEAPPSSPGAYAAPGKGAVGLRDTAPGVITFKAAVPAGSTKGTFSFKIVDRGGGGGGLFGPQGKPFAPVLFVKIDAPITWATKGKIASDADLTLVLEPKATSAEIEIPANAKEVFVQVGNAGDQDGAYTGISFAFEGAPPPVVPAVPNVPAPTPSSPAGAQEAESGCSVPASSGTSVPVGAAGLVGLVAAAFVARRRRR